MKPDIIFDNQDYIIINKPAGLMVHPDGRSNERTLCDFLLDEYPEINGVGEPLVLKSGEVIDRPGIVHRLDKETSGVMVVARNQKSFEYLKSQFQDRKVEKTYHTFVYGNIKEDEFEVAEPIGRSKKDFRRWMAGDNARGKLREAQTFFKVLKRSDDKKYTLLEAKPKTGRTHQIRVHLKYLYKPIVADTLYAPDRQAILGFERLALHAKKIEFTDSSGQKVEYEADYPEDFKNNIRKSKGF
jgi:23S rRNA pseudouridine1911/1915/1917 synthase